MAPTGLTIRSLTILSHMDHLLIVYKLQHQCQILTSGPGGSLLTVVLLVIHLIHYFVSIFFIKYFKQWISGPCMRRVHKISVFTLVQTMSLTIHTLLWHLPHTMPIYSLMSRLKIRERNGFCIVYNFKRGCSLLCCSWKVQWDMLSRWQNERALMKMVRNSRGKSLVILQQACHHRHREYWCRKRASSIQYGSRTSVSQTLANWNSKIEIRHWNRCWRR